MKLPASLNSITHRYDDKIREAAIQAANSRIILAGRKASDLSEEELEVIVKEEEDKIRGRIKEKGLLALAALLGLGWWV
ncbi:hypothetical protein [Catenovulum sediminis]|uniref:Uncharacterized protein n=1 Tax=Catenovulum sediminis TaxID=1740262 RepID=A0ABV1RBY5_9ALTE|nr:hypothetical protein [Catenovulum sediminis]